MADIRIKSVREPLTAPAVARTAVAAIGRAAAMGLLPADETVEVLDVPTLRRIARYVSRAGVARAATAELLGAGGEAGELAQAARLEAILRRLDEALVHSPVPEREWGEVGRILGVPLLGRLLGISPSSLRRYATGDRETPDDTAERLHFLALLIGDLAGTYNDVGVRRWFDRSRAQLGSRSPAQLLAGDWHADAAGPVAVRRLAEALLASPAT